jgi:hypothetical protein
MKMRTHLLISLPCFLLSVIATGSTLSIKQISQVRHSTFLRSGNLFSYEESEYFHALKRNFAGSRLFSLNHQTSHKVVREDGSYEREKSKIRFFHDESKNETFVDFDVAIESPGKNYERRYSMPITFSEGSSWRSFESGEPFEANATISGLAEYLINKNLIIEELVDSIFYRLSSLLKEWCIKSYSVGSIKSFYKNPAGITFQGNSEKLEMEVSPIVSNIEIELEDGFL